MSGVFRTIDPPPPHHPAFGAGGGQTRWVEKGWGVNNSEDARHWIDLLQYDPSTGESMENCKDSFTVQMVNLKTVIN